MAVQMSQSKNYGCTNVPVKELWLYKCPSQRTMAVQMSQSKNCLWLYKCPSQRTVCGCTNVPVKELWLYKCPSQRTVAVQMFQSKNYGYNIDIVLTNQRTIAFDAAPILQIKNKTIFWYKDNRCLL